MKKFFERLPWQTIFVAALAIFFLRNLLLPIVADDFSYAFIWDGEGRGNLIDGLDPNRLHRVESFADIFYSQWQHYFTWGGRTIAHCFVQFFVWQGKFLFDVANVFVFGALILLLFKVGTGLSLREMNKTYLLFIFAGLYFCAPSPLIDTIWLTGACNYLWMCTAIILFLLPFALKFRGQEIFLARIPIMALLGLIAGWSIEPGAAVAVVITFLFVLHFKREKNLQPWMKVGFIFLLVGTAILILSPGNVYRLELTNALEPDDIVPPDEQWTPQMFLTNFVIGFLPVFLRELILFVPIIFYFARANTSPAVTKFIATFAGASVLVLLVMMCSPEFPERAGFPSTIFLIVASLAALKEILPQMKEICRQRIKLATIAGTIFAAVWALSLLGCLYVEYDLHCQLNASSEYIAAHKNDALITVKPLEIPKWISPFVGTRTWDELTLWVGGDLEPAPDGNRDLTFAKYYGLKKIVAREKTFE